MAWYDDRTHVLRCVHETERIRDIQLDSLAHREKSALGAFRTDDEGVAEDNPDNVAFSVFSMILPALATRPPKMRAKSNRGHLENLYVQAAAASTTHIAKKQRIEREFAVGCWDFFFTPNAVGFVEMGPARMSDMTEDERRAAQGRLFDQGEQAQDLSDTSDDDKHPRATDTPLAQCPPHWPRFKSIDPKHAFFDLSGRGLNQARYTGHETVEDWEVLKARAEENPDDWDLDEVLAMDRCARDGQITKGESGDYASYYVIYIPGATIPGEDPEENDHGVILTLAGTYANFQTKLLDAREIRRPYYWKGHPDGPHIFGYQYATGNGESPFVTLLGVNEDALAMLESVTASVHQRVREHKTVFAFDQTLEQEVQPLIDARNGAYVGVPGLRDGMVQSFETSPVSQAEIAELREMQGNVARGVGIDDGQMGNADSDATATAVSVAARATQTKVGHIIDRWYAYVGDVMDRMCFASCFDDRVFVRLDDEARVATLRATLAPAAAQAGLTPEYVDALIESERDKAMSFQGGDFGDPKNGYDWSGVETYIEAHSMDAGFGERASAREQMWNEQLAQIGQLAATQPHIRWQQRLKATGEAFGIPDADQLLDPAIAQQIAQIAIASSQPEPVLEGAGGGGGTTDLRFIQGGSQNQGQPSGAYGQTV